MINFRRLVALISKETQQVIYDPSSILIAFVLPLVLLFIYGYGVNLDSNRIRIGLVLETTGQDIESLSTAFTNSKFMDVTIAKDRREVEEEMVEGRIRGMIIVPQNFNIQTALMDGGAQIQIISDGSEPNIASFVQGYVQSVIEIWLSHQAEDRGMEFSDSLIRTDPRFWYNSELKSRNFLVPGSVALTMTLIGTLLTALVMAREWERGTMEALMATPVSIIEIVIGKLIPYFVLGIFSLFICTMVATILYDVPFRSSIFALVVTSSVFLFTALGQGLLISSATKDQFVASQAALMSAFLPAFMLSGFIFEISAMPLPIRTLTHIVAARYYVSSLQTIFLTGNIWPLLISDIVYMLLIGSFFYIMIIRTTRKRLD